MSVCLSVSMFRMAGQTAGPIETTLTHALMSTQGVFLSRSMSRSFMYACGSDRITKRPERCAKATPGERCSNYVRRTGEATPGERLRNSVRTTVNYSSSNEARRRAASAEGASRTPSGGRVIATLELFGYDTVARFHLYELNHQVSALFACVHVEKSLACFAAYVAAPLELAVASLRST